ncbi:ABC transporter permease [Kitasatospora sp. NPDC057500]|uniref:ABC transporter permease n=1 Tax=Kitasatospora sp. NPDC057500 TaxID=3346151 RepID=UPI00368A0EFD
MTDRRLAVQLLRVGYRAGLNAESGRVRFTALLLAAFASIIACLTLTVGHLTYDQRETRNAARAPHFRLAPGEQATALWHSGFDSVGGRQFMVVEISPLVDNAPLPPGVTAWPAPGQAVLSPALLRAGRAEGITDRYGTVAGTIGRAGLETVDEKLVYVRPAVPFGPDDEGVLPIAGYGAPVGIATPTGDMLTTKPEWQFQSLIVGLLLLPALVLMFTAVRTGSRGRDRRTALTSVLGAGPRDRALINLGEAAVPVALGSLAGLAALTALLSADLRLPVVDYAVSAADLRAHTAALLLAWAAGAALSLAGLLALDRAETVRSRRPRPMGQRRSPLRTAVACPVMIFVAVRGPDFFSLESAGHTLVNYIGVLGTLATLPAAIGMVTAAAGEGLARAGRVLRRPAPVVSGRWMAAHPGVVARVVTGLVAGIILMIQLQVWFSTLSATVQNAKAVNQSVGRSVLEVQFSASDRTALEHFADALPENTLLVRVVVGSQPPQMQLNADCPTLEALKVRCNDSGPITVGGGSDPRVAAIAAWMGALPQNTTASSLGPLAPVPGDHMSQLLVLAQTPDEALSAAEIKTVAYRTLPGSISVEPLGGGWLVGANLTADQGRWIVLLGIAGVAVLALSFGVSGLTEFVRWSRTMAPIGSLTGNHRVLVGSAAWSVLLPVLIANGLGILVGAWLATPVTAQHHSSVSGTLLTASGLAVAILGILLWCWAVTTALRQTARWLPGAAD